MNELFFYSMYFIILKYKYKNENYWDFSFFFNKDYFELLY